MTLTVGVAQKDTTSSSKVNQKTETKTVQKKNNSELKGFVDKNGDGIDDRIENNEKGQRKGLHKRKRKRDLFIDKDGDGINDNRCNGFGLPGSHKGNNSKQKGKKGGPQ